MTTYSIQFTNNYSDPGENQDYAFFSDIPVVSSTSQATQIYSNVFLAKTLAQGANWNIDITKNYYACWSLFPASIPFTLTHILGCGTAAQQLAPGVKVSVGMGKLATLGTLDAPGCEFVATSGSPL
jgi:hypothetical protein